MTTICRLVWALVVAAWVGILPWGQWVFTQAAAPPLQGAVRTDRAKGQARWGNEEVLIILDASGSMQEPLEGGGNKMQAAKQVVRDLLAQLPTDLPLGLRVYGSTFNTITPCFSSRLEVPIGVHNREAIARSLDAVHPNGATPIAYSLKKAMTGDFSPHAKTKRIILVSDGEETCDADPCSVAVTMVSGNYNIQVNIIGFGNLSLAAMRQLRCISAATFGRFSTATTRAELARQMNDLLQPDLSVQGKVLPVPPASSSSSPGQTTPVGKPPASGTIKPTAPSSPPSSSEIDLRRL